MPERDNPNMQPESEFDRMLRSSLESYAGADADRGLAERILARVATECARGKRRRKLGWAIALPVAACLMVLALQVGSRLTHNSTDCANQARVSPPNLPLSSQGGPAAGRPEKLARRGDAAPRQRWSSRVITVAAAPRHLPKLDVFPSPLPLTSTEKEFIAYVARVPVAERKSLVEPEQQQEQQIAAPISIASLDIKPIEPPEPLGN
jgi:hypothetical protein